MIPIDVVLPKKNHILFLLDLRQYTKDELGEYLQEYGYTKMTEYRKEQLIERLYHLLMKDCGTFTLRLHEVLLNKNVLNTIHQYRTSRKIVQTSFVPPVYPQLILVKIDGCRYLVDFRRYTFNLISRVLKKKVVIKSVSKNIGIMQGLTHKATTMEFTWSDVSDIHEHLLLTLAMKMSDEDENMEFQQLLLEMADPEWAITGWGSISSI